MKPQEVITIFAQAPANIQSNQSVLKMHPELDQFFEKGMYVESIVQNSWGQGLVIITLVFRYYNASQSKIN